MGSSVTVLEQAYALHLQGRVAEAEAGYDRVLKREPEQPDAQHLKGVAAMQRGDLRTAVSLISRAIVNRPDEASFYGNLAAALLGLGLTDRAIEYASKGMSLGASSSQIYLVLGQCLQRKQEFESALAAFAAAIRRDQQCRKSLDGLLDCLRVLDRPAAVLEQLESLTLPLDDALLLRKAQALRGLGRHEEAMAALEACVDKRSGSWLVNRLKQHLESGELVEAIPFGQALLRWKDKVACEQMGVVEAAQARSHWPRTIPMFRPNDIGHPERNVICFSLWGVDPKYTYNAVLNAKRVPRVYPGWSARFYIDESVPAEIVRALVDYGARVIRVADDGRDNLRLFWRFFPSEDPSVERFLCRDCDSVINEREAAAVADWIESGRRFHLMRDHPEHAELIMAGMWGGIAGLLPKLSEQAIQYFESHVVKWRWVDQDFLRDRIWPVIKHDCLVHDDYYQMGGEVRPFPPTAVLPPGEHVGGYKPRFAAENGGGH
jgi:tetratricopeptide (TPR) repeat protein